ncbi:MAG TPA: hypothetical protein VNY35_11350 [Solirubrobacteraceae bacterium]|nr:hypothetical protein [Solirubrobacteraceae bacterium]
MAGQKLAFHEAGHYTVARQQGAPVVSCEVRRDDGATYGAQVMSDPRGKIAVLMAGGIAEELVWGPSGTEGYGSEDDKRQLAAVLHALHPACHAYKLAEGERIARSALSERWALLEGVAERLWLTGRFP